MQASLEAEARGKAEAMRVKKKLEQDINELEVALDTANRGRADAEKNIKKYQQQMRELQQQVITLMMMKITMRIVNFDHSVTFYERQQQQIPTADQRNIAR